MLPFDGGKPSPLIHTEADERDGQPSPDGKGIAYVSKLIGPGRGVRSVVPDPRSWTGDQSVDERKGRRRDGVTMAAAAVLCHGHRRLMAAPVHVASNGKDLEVGAAVASFETQVGHVSKPDRERTTWCRPMGSDFSVTRLFRIRVPC